MNRNNTNVILAAAAGLLVGGILGLLFAPEKGTNTRRVITDRTSGWIGKMRQNLPRKKRGGIPEPVGTYE